VPNSAGGTLAVVFRFESSEPGSVVAFLDSPEQGARGIPMGEITLEGDQFSVVVPAAQASYRGTLGTDTIEGTWAQGNITGPVTMTRGEYVPTVAALDLPPEALARLRGTWTGSMQPPQGGTIELVVRFETTADGVNLAFLDVPTRGAAGLVITAATLTGDALELSVPAGSLTIAGTITNGTFSGEWRQGTTNVPVTLTRQP
jgi:hypothetical protein